jgi:hypothetical protein
MEIKFFQTFFIFNFISMETSFKMTGNGSNKNYNIKQIKSTKRNHRKQYPTQRLKLD